MKNNKIIIIGSGLAGLFCALKLSPQKSTIISISNLGKGTSSELAQGGIAAAISNNDTLESHIYDTIVAGAGIVNIDSTTMMVNSTRDRINDLIKFGVNFDKNKNGTFILNKEAAHSNRRVIRINGDMTGKEIIKTLTIAVKNNPNIKIIENLEVIDLEVNNNKIKSIIVKKYNKNNTSIPYQIPVDALIMASGGIGQLFEITTNPITAKGDGLAMAARAGAVLADLEFVQFHPTAFNIGYDPAPLITEALRGDGAHLINDNGQRFMLDIHPNAELAPRDIVARAVFIQQTNGHKTYLDCRNIIDSHFKNNFPKVYSYCKNANIKPSTNLLPIYAAAHYHIGGIAVDNNGLTSIQGLWACGEVSNSGIHGANRLASNSLLEAIVYASNIAKNINKYLKFKKNKTSKPLTLKKYIYKNNYSLNQQLRKLMNKYVGIIRNKNGLIYALKQIKILQKNNKNYYPLINMLNVAHMITVAALLRKESRGVHYRDDYPKINNHLAKRNFYTLSTLNKFAIKLLY